MSAPIGVPDGAYRVTAPPDLRGGRYVSDVLRIDAAASDSTAAGKSDGHSASFTVSGAVAASRGNRGALIAHTVNGAGLGANGAARLMVPGDAKLGRSVSNLVAIEVFTAAPTPP